MLAARSATTQLLVPGLLVIAVAIDPAIDGFVTDLPPGLVRMLMPEPTGDLLGRPVFAPLVANVFAQLRMRIELGAVVGLGASLRSQALGGVGQIGPAGR